MIDPLQTALIVGFLLLAALATAYVVLDRLIDGFLLAVLVLLELGLVVQALVGVVQVARGEHPEANAAVFVGYLLGTLLFVPVATWWARGEPSRAGTAALIIVGLVVPVLVLRVEQVWTPGG